MRRTLMLDEDDLIMVVKEDVVKQIDQNRGEMNRTEFVNYLIQCQLREYYNQKEYTSKEEFERFTQQIMELLHNFLQFFISYGMSLGGQQPDVDIQKLSQQLESFYITDEDTEDS
jgi:cobalamin biosynthesis Mg chelatase CobN